MRPNADAERPPDEPTRDRSHASQPRFEDELVPASPEADALLRKVVIAVACVEAALLLFALLSKLDLVPF